MAPRNPPLYLQAGTYSSQSDRILLAMLTDRTTNATGTTFTQLGGVMPPSNQMQVTAVGGTSLGFVISAGLAVIPSATKDPPGAYVCCNEGNYSGAVDAATANRRYDLVIAEVRDVEAGAVAGTNDWQFRIIKGGESANPVAPTAPTNSIPLARISVKPPSQNAGVNKIAAADITDLRTMLAAPGGVHLVFPGVPSPPHSPGRVAYNIVNKAFYVSDGTIWQVIYTKDQLQSYIHQYGFKFDNTYTAYYWEASYGTALPFVWSTGKREVNDIKVTLQSPSGSLMIAVSGFVRAAAAGVEARIGFQVTRASNNEILYEHAVDRTISNYGQDWISSSYIRPVGGLPINEDLTVRIVFLRTGVAGRAYFDNVQLTSWAQI